MTLLELLQGARDYSQGASNAVASTVSAPVDGLAWLLRQGGMKGVDKPVMGSDWMREKGLTSEPVTSLAGMFGEAAGNVLPFAMGAKAPQLAARLNQMGANMAAPVTANKQLGAVVYHGSPHKFDAFDSSKIGTGEGAQAYGHGLYLAESPGVAKQYSQVLSDSAKLTPEGRAARALSENGDDLIAAKQAIYRDYNAATSPALQNSALKAIDVLQSGKAKAPQLYKVDLPDNAIAKMLNYDAPVPEAMRKPLSEAAMNQFGSGATGTSGEHLYKEVIANFKQAGHPNPTQAATDWLTKQGVPGMRYLDGGSRGAGAGTSNYVVFPGNESLLKILQRNGQNLP